MGGFEDLEVWQLSKELAVKIYLLTSNTPLKNDFGLRDQIRQCAVSIPSNIAEGDERNSNPDSVRHFKIAKGSLAELRTQMMIAHEIGYINKQDFDNLNNAYRILGHKLGRLIETRKRSPSPITHNRKNEKPCPNEPTSKKY